MSNLNYLFIKNLSITVQEALIHDQMRDKFALIVEKCSIIERLAVIGEQPQTSAKTLVPVAYNLIVDALEDPVLLDRLIEISQQSGYWFFNVFIIPRIIPFDIPINTASGVSKGITRGIDKESQ